LVPYGLIWFAAFYGYGQLQAYSKAVPHSGEGKAFRKISDGLRILAWGLILQAMLALILNAVALGNTGLHAFITIVNHYFALAVALVAFIYVNNGTHQLVNLVHARLSQFGTRILIVVAALVGALFQHYVVINQNTNQNPFYLSIYPLIITIIVPYIFTWVVGIISVYELRAYAARVKGVLFRHALDQLAAGLIIVILISIAVQYVTTAFSASAHPSLGSMLTIGYILLAVEALGFALVAFGAKRLKKIEEV